MRALPLALGLMVLALAWLGPLPDWARQSFSAHMSMHMAVVALGAPLVALGISGSALDPAAAAPRFFAPIPASIAELVVVWVWHTPVLHHAARHDTWALIIEQSSFLAAGLVLWIAAIGGRADHVKSRNAAGVAALLFTSMHMTLLGALFAMAPRTLYHVTEAAGDTLLIDQHRGGIVMLLVGGASYLAGGLWLTANLLHVTRAERQEAS
jgi:putative membrane protein